MELKQRIEAESIKIQLAIAEAELKRNRLKRMHNRLDFALSNHITHKRKYLDFQDHKYLLPVYCDDAPVMAIGKPSQMGISEYALVIVYESLAAGRNVFYVLPKSALRDMFVKTRMNASLHESAYYQQMMGKDKEGSVRTKKFKNADIAFVAASKDNEMISFVADVLIVDELNFCNKRQVKHAKKRLGHSQNKIEKYISTHTVKGVGIDEKLKSTDCKWWMQRCQHCGKRQVLDFFVNVLHGEDGDIIGMNADSTDLGVWCCHCGGEMDRLGNGEYVAENTAVDRMVSGYQIPPFASPNKSVSEIYQEYKESKHNDYYMQLWYNNELGLPYTAEGAKLTDLVLDDCCAEYVLDGVSLCKNKRMITAGIDVGAYFHIRISADLGDGERQAIYIGKIRVKGGGKEEVIQLLKDYNVNVAVFDAAPERNMIDEIKTALPDIAWSCEYVGGDRSKAPFIVHEADRVIDVNRTWSLDSMVTSVRKAKLYLPANAKTILDGEYYKHMKASTRMLIKNEKGEERYVWEEGSQADHFFHAENYDSIALRVAYEMYGEPNIRIV